MDRNDKKLIFSSLKNTALVYLVISFLTGKMSVFAAFCAGLPFCLPITDKRELTTLQTVKQSLQFGIPGILLSVIFMLLTGSYSSKVWIFPAILGFSVCYIYCCIRNKVSGRTIVTVRSVMLTGILLVCFL